MEAQLRGWLAPVLGGGPSGAATGPPSLPADLPPLLERFERREAPALFCYTAPDTGQLQAAASMPASFGKLLYVLREPHAAASGNGSSAAASVCNTARSAASGTQHSAPASAPLAVGYLDGGRSTLAQLQELLAGCYLPHLHAAAAGSWPETLAQDWAAGAQAYASALTEAVHAAHGKTALFVPLEELGEAGTAARRRELVQRLEVQLLRWTQQIRDLLDRHGSREAAGGDAGPAGEVTFWRGRTADLGGLRDQLEGERLGRVLRVLEAAQSPHLPAFQALRGSIAAEAEQAASNLAFLQELEGPCAALEAAPPTGLATVLPPVLDVLRGVWALAPHYSSPDQMTGLLRQVSNAVVARCRACLDLRAILEGRQLGDVVARLEECCSAAAAWRAAYGDAAARASAALPSRPWAFDSAAIFAHVEAFVQRCRDLQELCAAQQQFGCGPALAGVLSGAEAAEVARALSEVQAAFAQQMARLQSLPYDVLDVRNSAWYEDVAAFRAGARDLEQMLANILGSAAAQAPGLPARLDIIQAFAAITMRDGLRKAVEARMTNWHQAFLRELSAVKAAFEGIKAELPPGGPPLAPHALRVLLLRGLLRRIERCWDQLAGMGGAMPTVPKAAESVAAYEALHMGLQQHINALNMGWYSSVPGDLAAAMAGSNLLQQEKAAGGLLRVSMPPHLHAALEEAFLFERQRMAVPPAAGALLPERQRLRALWAGAVGVSRAYNAVLGSLSSEDRRLCRDRIRYLDRRVLPGVNKLTWGSPRHAADYYHRDALRSCRDVASAVAELQAGTAAVAATAALFREALLVRVERKRLHDLPDWDARQSAHLATTRASMAEAYDVLRSALVSLYRRFAADSEEVQQEWLAFVRRADAALLEALTACVRRSLLEVARALQGGEQRGGGGGGAGGAGAEVSPVFVLNVILDTNGRVELKPALQQLFDTVHATCTGAVDSLEGLPRLLPEVLAGCAAAGPLPTCLRGVEEPQAFVAVVRASEEAVAKQMQAITQGIQAIVEKAHQLLTFHERKYMTPLWQTECSAYMRRYERANKPVASFLADTQKYVDLKEEVLGEDSASNVRWLRLDASTLKQQLVALCDNWVNAFTGLLASLATRQLSSVTTELQEATAALTGSSSATGGGAGAGQDGMEGGEEDAAAEGQGGDGKAADEAGQEEAQEGVQQEGEQEEAREGEPEGEPEAAPASAEPLTGLAAAEALEALHGRLEARRDELQAEVVACQEKYDALVQLQVGVPDDELAGVDALQGLWSDFVAALDAVPARLRELGA